MGTAMKADIQEMFALAQKMFDKADEFKNIYGRMFSVINADLSQSWKGPDSDSFIERTNSVQVKFEKMYDILYSYGEFMLDAARRYQKETEENSNEAGSIEL